MAFFRSSLSAALLSVSLVACGGSGGGGGSVTPEGMHYHYVANKVNVPTSNSQAHEWGLDLNGDGTVDNQLGSVLGTLSGLNFNIQGTVDKAVAEGSIILLLDYQTKDFTSASASGLQAYLGTNPVPPACAGSDMYNEMTMTGCGQQLTGTGMFTATSNSDDALAGPVAGGTFTGGPGKISLQIALGGTQAINLDLIGAQAKGSGITATAIGTASSGGLVLAGALTQDDLNNKVLPAVTSEVQGLVVTDCCGGPTSPTPTCNYSGTPSCGCTANSTGSTILGEFDTNHDCAVTLDELKSNNIIQSFLAPDVMIDTATNKACTSGATCAPALSLGIQVTGVGAQYTVAGESQ